GMKLGFILFFFSSRRRHTRFSRDWSSDVCSSDLTEQVSVAFCRPGLPSLDRPERRFRGSCPLFRRSGCPEPHTKGKHGSNLSSKPTASLSGCHPSHAGHSIKASAQDLSRLQSRTGCAFSLSASGIRPPNMPGGRNSS